MNVQWDFEEYLARVSFQRLWRRANARSVNLEMLGPHVSDYHLLEIFTIASFEFNSQNSVCLSYLFKFCDPKGEKQLI